MEYDSVVWFFDVQFEGNLVVFGVEDGMMLIVIDLYYVF